MPISDGKMTFYDGVNTIEITRPVFPYKTVIDLPFNMTRLDNGHYSIYDPTSTYDLRYCECNFQLNSTEQGYLVDFLSDSTKGRGKSNVTMTLPAGSGFHPFGPDKADGGAFTVSLDVLDFKGAQDAPYLNFESGIRITNEGSFPAHSYPTDRDEGTWTLGTVTGVRFPPNWFQPKKQYQVYGSFGRGGSLDFVDRGSSGDSFNTKFRLTCNESKASRIINYLTGTARASQFNVTSSTNHWMFGYDKGSSGTYTVQMIQNKITIQHNKYDDFDFELQLNHIATS